MDHDYAIASDCQRVQLPTFYPDASHYIYHQPEWHEKHYSDGLGQMRNMQHSGSSPPEILRGLEQVPPIPPPPTQSLIKDISTRLATPDTKRLSNDTRKVSAALATEPNTRLRNFLIILMGIVLFLGLVFLVQKFMK